MCKHKLHSKTRDVNLKITSEALSCYTRDHCEPLSCPLVPVDSKSHKITQLEGLAWFNCHLTFCK